MPHNLEIPHYTCEACQVRAVLDREVSKTGRDIALLMLERMRSIDSFNYLAATTAASYHSSLAELRRFEKWAGTPILLPSAVAHPSTSPCIPLQWAELQATLRTKSDGERVRRATTRRLRSAAHYWYTLDMATAYPRQAYREDDQRCTIQRYCAPTDELLMTHFSSGIDRRMGRATKPSWALAHVHIKWIDDQLELLFVSPHNTEARRHDICIAGFYNIMAWLGWIRGSEVSQMEWDDVEATPPADGPIHGLPVGVGVILIRLLEETKSDPTRVADLVMAWKCISGLSLGKWWERLLLFPRHITGRVLSSAVQQRWSSCYFRNAYAWPLLEQQRLQGEPTLQRFSGEEGNRIQDHVYSLNSWRRGGRSRVERTPRPDEPIVARLPDGTVVRRRKASPTEVNEHGRWRVKNRRSEPMPVHYNQWEVFDRLLLTLRCM